MISFFTIFFKYLILVCLSLQGYMLSPFDNRSNRTIIWQAGSNYPRIKKTRCLADKHNIDYIQTFRFIELNNSLRETVDKSTKNTDPCGVNVKIILYIGPTRKQLNSLKVIQFLSQSGLSLPEVSRKSAGYCDARNRLASWNSALA